MLSGSTLQGKLLIGETNFESLFSEINGYRFFLIASDPKLAVGSDELIEKRAEVASVLESRLGDVGMDVTPSAEVLAGLLAVQNTYLRTFQSLGALGLLLGTIGLAVAQLRSVLERRRELAVMRAIGFTPARLGSMVLGETAVLLLVGIGCGTLCAVLAVLPHAVVSGVRPPVGEPVVVLLGILLFGMLAGLAAVSRVVRMPLVGSLRAD
ncbi:MAG: ABC transporter permease [Planctomycetota bacterium]